MRKDIYKESYNIYKKKWERRKKRMMRKALTVAMTAAMLLAPVPAGAKGRIDVDIPVTAKGKGEHVFTIASDDAPVPKENAIRLNGTDGKFTVSVQEPTTYHYRITDNTGKTYRVSVYVTTDDAGDLSAQTTATGDGRTKSSVEYDYGSPKTVNAGKKVSTWDDTDARGSIALIGASVVGILCVIANGRKRKRDGERK